MRLNKYIAHCGIGTRRTAADLVKAGEIYVNGKVETNPGYQVKEQDTVTYKDKALHVVKNKTYLLLNKPKNTSLSKEDSRKTVYEFLKDYASENLISASNLSYESSGLLIMTNDEGFVEKLSDPSQKLIAIYHIILDKPLTDEHLKSLEKGFEFEGKQIQIKEINYVKGAARTELGIKTFTYQDHEIRTILEHLGYAIIKLDRTYFAGLTKKDLPRGFSRKLSEEEISRLKYL